jgi:hypothetical protein
VAGPLAQLCRRDGHGDRKHDRVRERVEQSGQEERQDVWRDGQQSRAERHRQSAGDVQAAEILARGQWTNKHSDDERHEDGNGRNLTEERDVRRRI